MRKVIILSGISGSGKSTYAQKLVDEADRRGEIHSTVHDVQLVSADDYFTATWQEGAETKSEYNFDPSKLSKAHQQCFRDFLSAVQSWASGLVIVDNTNTTAAEIAPYYLGAEAFGWEVEIHTLVCSTYESVEKCAARNIHNVPLTGILSQAARIASGNRAFYWKNVDVEVSF